MSGNKQEVAGNNIVFFIDKIQFKTSQSEMTVKELLSQYAKEDPAETTLVLKHGNDLTKFEDDNQLVSLKNGMHFVVFYDGPTPVSFFGPERLISELNELGYEAELVTGSDNQLYAVIRDYEIPLGKFVGKIIDLGFLATPNFPQSVGSSVHVRANPQLYEKTDTIPDVRNIIDSALGNKWRYWSKNFNWKQQHHVKRLMAQIAGVFNDA